MFIIFTVLLRELEAPEVHLKSVYSTIKDSVTLNSISQALQVHNEILRKRTRQKNDGVLSQSLSGSVTFTDPGGNNGYKRLSEFMALEWQYGFGRASVCHFVQSCAVRLPPVLGWQARHTDLQENLGISDEFHSAFTIAAFHIY